VAKANLRDLVRVGAAAVYRGLGPAGAVMTDRELLELAAKAAGEWSRLEPLEHLLDRWNPLTDDGDALRLAVTLRINIEHAETLGREPHGVNCWPVGQGHCAWMENDLTDYNAATRRAIVRAAAEIGRNMT
jgi:hypothetical protein